MKKVILGAALLFTLFWGNAALAVEPSSMVSAAPKALELAAIWSPHTINAMQSTGSGLLEIGKATLNILRLPLGILQCTAGAPFGLFDSGTQNVLQGLSAPFELIYQVILLPIRIVSLGTVR